MFKNKVFVIIAALVLLFTPFCAVAADKFVVPPQTIVAPDSPVAYGEIIALYPSEIVEKPEFFHSVSYSWKILEGGVPKHVERGEGDRVLFGSGIKPKRICALLSCSYLFIVKDKDNVIKEVAVRTQLLMTIIKVGDKEPDPEPGPGPKPPDPDPTFTNPLSKQIYVWYKDQVKLTGADKVKGAQALSESFSSVASQIAAGAIKTLNEGLTKSKESNHSRLQAVQLDPTAFATFSTSMKDYLLKEYNEKKLVTAADLAIRLNQISEGLSKIR